MPRAPKHYWEHDDRYPSEGPFGRLLEWHLIHWRTRKDCSLSQPNPRATTLSAFAHDVHDRVQIEGNDSPEKALNNWRTGKYFPEDDLLLDRICLFLFGDDLRLRNWEADLRRFYRNEKNRKSNPEVTSKNLHVASMPRLTPYFQGRNDERDMLANIITSGEVATILVQGDRASARQS